MILTDDSRLHRSAVVANCKMNRGRGLSSYARDLRLNVLEFMASRRVVRVPSASV